jgi:hypothetical protein
MKPQETAQERAEEFVHKKYGLSPDLSEQVQSDFIAGEESGERITLERLAVAVIVWTLTRDSLSKGESRVLELASKHKELIKEKE